MTGPAPARRSLWQREPVRVISAVATFLGATNAVLLGAGVYDGGAAAAVTGILAAGGALAAELARSEVAPVGPLEDLAAAAPPPAG